MARFEHPTDPHQMTAPDLSTGPLLGWQAALVMGLSLSIGTVCRAELSSDGSHWLHTVRPGDTLVALAEGWTKPGTSWRAIAEANRISDPHRLQPGTTLRVPRALLREEPLPMDVLHAHGQVLRERPGETAVALAGGMTVLSGDVIRTGRQSTVSLRAPDGTTISLREDSVLHLQHHARLGRGTQQTSDLRLDKGSAETRVTPTPPGQVRPRVEFRTPVIHLGVRGTDFRVRSTEGQATAEVLSGRVEAASAGGVSAVALAAGFGIQATREGLGTPQALPPSPVIENLPQKVERLPLALTWQAQPSAGWRAQIHRVGQPDEVLLDGTFKQPRAQWVDELPDGRYGLRLRAIDAQGFEGPDARYEFELKARPEPPFLNAPADKARNAEATQTFRWTGQAEAARYRLQVADQADFTQPRLDRADISSTTAQIELPEGTHHWRVASIRADGDVGPWSDAQTVTRVAQPAAPGLDPPQAGADGLRVRWRATPGLRYQLQVARDPGFLTPLADTVVDQAEWLLPQPEPGTYYLRVRSISSEGFEGPYGATQTLEVPRPPTPVWPWLLPWLLLLL